MRSCVKRGRLLVVLWLLWAGLFPMLFAIMRVLGVITGHRGIPHWFYLVLIPMTFWCMPPCSVAPWFFDSEGGVMLPCDWVGWTVGIVFYSVVAVCLWLPFALRKR